MEISTEIVRQYWTAMAASASPDDTSDTVRDRVERQWPTLTREPGGVDYIEVAVAGLPALWAVPHGSSQIHTLLGIHGGGGVSGSIYTHRKLFGQLAKTAGLRALIPEYRAELHHPIPLDDTVAAYQSLLDEGVSSDQVVFAGDSLGGGLAISAALKARELGLPLPAGIYLMSPWVDLAVSQDSFETNQGSEAFFFRGVVSYLAAGYLDGADPRDPFASPLYADLADLPAMYIQVGGDETLLGEAEELARRAGKAGVDVAIDVFPGQLHTFQMAAGYEAAADQAIAQAASWITARLGSRPGSVGAR